jgi:MoxR-like ATPase
MAQPQVQSPTATRGVNERLQHIAQVLDDHFLDKSEIVRLLLISAIAGEHMLIVGPPGTAKSALVRMFARMLDARYYEYLLTRFSEPNEIFGPVDIAAFRSGVYQRKIEGMLPTAEVVFLDEIFKANSAILNSLLSIMNERRFNNGAQVVRCPLIALFAASNEVPNDDALAAIFDRFLLRVLSDNLDSFHFNELIAKGLRYEADAARGVLDQMPTVLPASALAELGRTFADRVQFPDDFLSAYKGLVFQIRSEGISVSDRRLVKLLKLFAAAAILDGRDACQVGDLFILKHVWNNMEQREILLEIVGPVLDRFYQEHPDQRPVRAVGAGMDNLVRELNLIRELLTSGEPLSDIQLFSQLRNLNEIKAALAQIGGEAATRLVQHVDQLLEHIFSSSKFA